MKWNDKNAVFKSVLLCALFLAVVPAASGNAQAGEISVSSGTTAGELSGSPDLAGSGVKVTVVGKDGSARTGALQDGDTVLVRDAAGNVTGSYRISLSGADSGSSSGRDESSGADAPPAGGSSGGLSGASGSAGSRVSEESFPSASQRGGLYLFSQPVTVEDLCRQLNSQSGNVALRAVVTAFSGAVKGSGPVCTGDTVAVKDASGAEVSSVTAVVRGDLTRCGEPTSAGCSLLYDCLTGKRSLSADLSEAADLNCSGGADTADLLLLKKLVSGVP